jgi:hypothetical protein
MSLALTSRLNAVLSSTGVIPKTRVRSSESRDLARIAPYLPNLRPCATSQEASQTSAHPSARREQAIRLVILSGAKDLSSSSLFDLSS